MANSQNFHYGLFQNETDSISDATWLFWFCLNEWSLMCLSSTVFFKKGQRNKNNSGDGRRFEQLRGKGFWFRFRAVPEDSGKDTRKKRLFKLWQCFWNWDEDGLLQCALSLKTTQKFQWVQNAAVGAHNFDHVTFLLCDLQWEQFKVLVITLTPSMAHGEVIHGIAFP